MYLKTLELFGFKSFAERTIVQFHEGITAIVGPNGCGKSNVLDSIRWVLGEQSAKALRGGEMTDVIFNGTDDRKPLNLAEVSLTFADCEKELGVDWSEVRVTRRVFRDGKSEYLLNNVGCRLKDIQSLFMDTGIGRSAYSIMEQGKIDQILSSRPEDRRAVFEEAAGITKFKSQKKEALRKLEHTEGNLIRVTDVIREVKRQIGSLQRQAGKARRYQVLMSDLQVLDTHLSRVRFDALREDERGINEALDRLGGQLESHQGRLEQFESEIMKQRMVLAEIEERADAARQRVQAIQSSIQGKRSRIEFNRERIIEFNALIRRYGEETEEALVRLEEQREALVRLESEINEATASLATEEATLKEKNAAAEEIRQQRIAAERASEDLRQKVAVTDNRIFSLRSEASNNRTLNETLDARLAALNHESATLQENEGAARSRLEDARAQLESAKAQLEDLKREGEGAQVRHGDAAASLRAADQELAALSNEIGSREMRRDTLIELNAAGDGADEGTQEILQGLGDPQHFSGGVHGLLPSLLEVEEGFVPAIDAALAHETQAVLVDEGAALDEILRRFNEGRMGRAAVAIDALVGKHSGEAWPEPPGVICRARDKVRPDPKAADLVGSLLAGVFVVETLEDAVALKRANAGAFVTLDGAFVSQEGVIRAGTQKGAVQSLLQRKAQIASIDSGLEGLRSERDTLARKRDESQEAVDEAQSLLDDLRERYQEARLSAGVLERQIADGERELQNLLSRAETLDRESRQQVTRQQAAMAKVTEMEALVEAESGSIGQLRSDLEAATKGLDELRAVESQQMLDAGEARVAVATARQRIEGLHAQKRPVEARIEELTQLIAARGRDGEAYGTRISENDAESARLASEIETENTELAAAEASVSEVLGEREKSGAQISEAEKELRAIREMVDRIRSERGQYEVRQTQTSLKSENLREYVGRRYQIEIEDFTSDSYKLLKTIDGVRKARARAAARAESDPAQDELAAVEASLTAPEGTPEGEALATPLGNPSEQPIDWEFVEQMVDDLTQKLDAMGPVNLDAIQEFAELEERYAFLEQQNTDLLNAKEELLEAIARINRTTEELFSETFARLREHFQLMFRELFGGGKADLALMDSQDPLECGIEIIAKPPGKQPQAISLLSGGERAMTAVSLLFAIYMVKPSPFCVLDEMDAPLDDSNINRFVKILEQFAAQSQFVVISHNKRTIAKSNYLYGVTMESKGISRLVGVRFGKVETGTNGSGNGDDVLSTSEPPSIAESFGKSGNLHSEDLRAARES